MIGKSYLEVLKNLFKNGWTCLDSEDGWSRFIKWHGNQTTGLEISYNTDKIITDVYKYSY